VDPILKQHQIRKIDNRRISMPAKTIFLIVFLIFILTWFVRGGSFKLYASIFFSLYYFTQQIWVSVLLIGVLQNIALLPLRFIGLKQAVAFDSFERAIEESSNQEAYLVFKKKITTGDSTIIFYIFSFVINAIAFVSAGRIFLIDFYTQKLDPKLLYKWVPYPDYPLQGSDFKLPFVKVTETMAMSWKNIFLIWVGITLFFVVLKILWRFFRIFLSKNKQILKVRINYNRAMATTSGFSLTLLVLSIVFFRNIPIKWSFITLVADLTRQNSTMNLVTAIGTFITTMHAGYTRIRIDREIALARGLKKEAINTVTKDKIRQTTRNAVFLGLGAYLITNQIPCAFELSVATFEFLYILSPYTFDKLLVRMGAPKNKKEAILVPETTKEI
jgi:hypothetical protein